MLGSQRTAHHSGAVTQKPALTVQQEADANSPAQIGDQRCPIEVLWIPGCTVAGQQSSPSNSVREGKGLDRYHEKCKATSQHCGELALC